MARSLRKLANAELADRFERRFRPEFRPVFQAWLALDPFNNQAAPPGPPFMPQYPSSLGDDADQLETHTGLSKASILGVSASGRSWRLG